MDKSKELFYLVYHDHKILVGKIINNPAALGSHINTS